MNRQERQQLILSLLRATNEPVRGEDLAQSAHVTRQVIVHEIALMRAAGVPIVSTPQGYRWTDAGEHETRTIIALRHTPEQTAGELYTLVDHGLVVHNVMVDHPIYGQIEGGLEIRSRVDADAFLAQIAAAGASLLSSLTDGYHMHTVSYRNPQDLDAARIALGRLRIAVME